MTQQKHFSSGLKPSFAWYRYDTTCVVKQLHSSETGLSPDEAHLRLMELGRNQLRACKSKGVLQRFLRHFNSMLIYGLLIAAGLSAGMGHRTAAAVVTGSAIVYALAGFLKENKAEKRLRRIEKILSAQARVMREGQEQMLDASEVVEGDIVNLRAGDRVTADMRLLEVHNLQVNESLLTGKSTPVAKQTATIAAEVMLSNRSNLVFSGTRVNAGSATGIVIATGRDTELGRATL